MTDKTAKRLNNLKPKSANAGPQPRGRKPGPPATGPRHRGRKPGPPATGPRHRGRKPEPPATGPRHRGRKPGPPATGPRHRGRKPGPPATGPRHRGRKPGPPTTGAAQPGGEQPLASGGGTKGGPESQGRRGRKPSAAKKRKPAPGRGAERLRSSINSLVSEESDRIARALVDKTLSGNMTGARLLVELTGANKPPVNDELSAHDKALYALLPSEPDGDDDDCDEETPRRVQSIAEMLAREPQWGPETEERLSRGEVWDWKNQCWLPPGSKVPS